jgi:hypothetical protein
MYFKYFWVLSSGALLGLVSMGYQRFLSLFLAMVFSLPSLLAYSQPVFAEVSESNSTSKDKDDNSEKEEKKPKLTTVAPAKLSVNQTTRVTLTGSNLANINQVQFDSGSDIVARILYGNDTESWVSEKSE